MGRNLLDRLMPGERRPPARVAEAPVRAARERARELLTRAATRLDGLYALLESDDGRDAALLADLLAEDLDTAAAVLGWREKRSLTLERAEGGLLPPPETLAAFAGLAEARLAALGQALARRRDRDWALPEDRFQARALWRARAVLLVGVVVLSAAILLGEAMAKRTRQFAAAVALERQRREAAAALADIAGLAQAAKAATGRSLIDITGSNCSLCGCDGRDLRNAPEGDICVRKWHAALERIGQAAAAGPGRLARLARDPWGSPYLLNENEGESADFPFEPDTIATAGQNGLAGDADDIVLAVPLAGQGR
ncbi:MAG: hypothetical protein ACP59X_08095 [Solidesulfovibrio sp. DCME]|uniref:hypothetical protein n=1 Tax=Solidesulfovibrio sp. DCME TaxID=3447380 RepID=UPI003D0EC03C